MPTACFHPRPAVKLLGSFLRLDLAKVVNVEEVEDLPYWMDFLLVPVWTAHFVSLIFFRFCVSKEFKVISVFTTLKVVICYNIIQGYLKG